MDTAQPAWRPRGFRRAHPRAPRDDSRAGFLHVRILGQCSSTAGILQPRPLFGRGRTAEQSVELPLLGHGVGLTGGCDEIQPRFRAQTQ